MYAVVVHFEVKPDHTEEFLPLMMENAHASVTTEPGCQQFDVCVNDSDPAKVFLYEVYDDRAAFEAHMATDHFAAFGKSADHMFADKRIETFDTVRR